MIFNKTKKVVQIICVIDSDYSCGKTQIYTCVIYVLFILVPFRIYLSY